MDAKKTPHRCAYMRGPILPQSRNSLELTYADRWAHADRFAARSPGAVAPCRRMLVASSTPLEPGPLAGAPHWGCRSSHSAPELTAARSCSRAHRHRPRSEQLPHVVRTGAASPPHLAGARRHSYRSLVLMGAHQCSRLRSHNSRTTARVTRRGLTPLDGARRR